MFWKSFSKKDNCIDKNLFCMLKLIRKLNQNLYKLCPLIKLGIVSVMIEVEFKIKDETLDCPERLNKRMIRNVVVEIINFGCSLLRKQIATKEMLNGL